jgi:hypothetical protein
MEIESNLDSNSKLRVNSYRQFDLLSKDNSELVSFNDFDLPVSALIKDNELQTINQLREKYPDVEFKISEDYLDTIFNIDNEFNEENMPPYLLYLTDEFFKQNPDAVNNIPLIAFNNEDNAVFTREGFDIFSGRYYKESIYIGEGITDRYLDKVREINNPIKIIEHEYEHLLDNLISEKEIELLEKLEEDGVENKELTLKDAYNKLMFDSLIELKQNSQVQDFFKEANAISLSNASGISNGEFMNELILNVFSGENLTQKDIIEFNKLFIESTGFPTAYTLKDLKLKSRTFFEIKGEAYNDYRFSEVSSTLREQTDEQIISKLNSNNPKIRETTEKTIQIAFDSGKMDVEKYKKLMGSNHCQKSDCSDKKCLIYKLLCEK